MGTKVKSVRVEMGDSVDVGDTLVINNSCRFSTAKLPTKVSDLANDCCYLTEEALSCAVCGKADKEYVDCCLSAKQDCGDYALNCDLTSGLNSKQDVINDLSTIRANACCGKAAHTTIGTYGDIVTHDACEFQEAGDYALNCTMTACLACKYDASNPCCYQTATEVACTVSPKADKTYVDCCIGELENDIEQLQGRGKFLSNWDATTGKPETDPETLPYEYHTGDYYMVTVVGSNNKRPTGSSYTGEASTTAETSELAEGDMYAYDGTNWLLQSNHGKTVSFANLSGVPSDNACLCSELASKQDNIDDLNTIRTNACCGKSASDTIATYGDVVTHNSCEFQVAGDYATNSTLESCLACKQNNISDLDTIRTNACCGACAKTIISGYGDIVSHNASEFQAAGSYAQCCDLTTGLSGKVDKVNGINRIYGTDGSGCQTDYAYSDTVTGNSVAKRDACGNLCVADPTCNSHAATKGYVDDKVDNKVICWGSIAGTLACQTDLQTALNCKQDNISDLNSIRIGAGKGDTAVQPGDLAAVATSGKYCDLTGIPCATTGGTAIAVSNGQVSVCYDNNTIKVNNSDQIYADYTGLQKTCNLVTNFSNADDTHYPSAKAVADIVEGMSGGNMIKEIYDPCNCRKNMYDMDNMYDGSVNKVVTATEKTLWDAKQEALTLPSNPTCGHLVVWGANKKTFVDGGEIPNSATWGCITGTLSNQTDLQNALNCKAQCCDIPTDNCQLANSCGYTTCTGTLTENSLKTVNGCSLVGSGDICIEGGGCSEWGCITGTLCDQTDLQGALDCKADLYSCVNSHGEVSERCISKSSIYFGYDSGVGTIYGTQICNRGYVNAFKECCDGVGCGIHLGADGLCYEQSDENWDTECGFSLTTGGICSYGNCVTARCYPFDGACRIATLCDLPAESNTKTFYLSSTSDLTNAQAAYDWYVAGNNPIIQYKYSGKTYPYTYILEDNGTSSKMRFKSTHLNKVNAVNSSYVNQFYIEFTISSGNVTEISSSTMEASPDVLATNVNYSSVYTPLYNGSPTTKKYVDDKVYTGDTAPVTAVEGQIWSDTCSNMVKYYDGSQWNVLTAGGSTGTGDVTGPNSSVDGHIAVFDSTSGKIIKDGGPVPEGKSYCAGEGINIIETTDRDTRGPAPVGFHVPTLSELQGLNSAGQTLGAWSSSCSMCMSDIMKMPISGTLQRDGGYNTNCSATSSAMVGYWSANCSGSNTLFGVMRLYLSGCIDTIGMTPNCGYHIRAFKNEPVIPDSSWTTLYDGSGVAAGAGIFCNSALGLISISSDGISWTTIQDKNLGAIDVYNYGDETTPHNSGCFYQRGNNYGFPYTGAIKISSGVIANAKCYGPGNYYCSDTFVPGTTGWRGCVAQVNVNAWGGATNCCTGPNPFIVNSDSPVPRKTSDLVNDCKFASVSAGPGIHIGYYADYSAIRGPAPEGFHIPSYDEMLRMCNTVCLFGFGCGCIDVHATYFKMPPGGRLTYCGSVGSQGSGGYYWSASGYCGCYGRALCSFSTSGGYSILYNAYGLPIRAFKDEPVEPDETWTTLYDGGCIMPGAGIFCNCTLGLISFSCDGCTWTTLADKNIGATVVYNCGDTVCAENVGCYFQWGNNYGFPYTGAVNKDTCCVDTSCYGPGNFYCCNIYRCRTGNCYWTLNSNLWGGETGYTVSNDTISNIYPFMPANDGCVGQVIQKTPTGYCWATPQSGDTSTVVSGDTGCIYTIKVSNTAPTAGTPNTTITFVME